MGETVSPPFPSLPQLEHERKTRDLETLVDELTLKVAQYAKYKILYERIKEAMSDAEDS